MKRLNYLFGLALILLGFSWASAETVTNYTVDFNTRINTSDHAFKVASGWGHIVYSEEQEDWYGDTETVYTPYTYYTTSGVDGTGALFCGAQLSTTNYDHLVEHLGGHALALVRQEAREALLVEDGLAGHAQLCPRLLRIWGGDHRGNRC